ncbi:MAG: diacylglycerol kinase family lipid kinase [Clostridia bacterium]|nr:diacylglycerol kinase family lipid kinase [Clostridia bacterium]
MVYHFIMNPKSGRSRKQKHLETTIKAACQERNLDYRIYYTTCPNDATEYVKSMIRITDERQRFICVGGDGTINEVVSSAPCNPNVEFGVIPYGSGNDFVKNFSNTKLFSDITAQIEGDTVTLDLIKVNDYYCVNMVNIGFDCMVVKESNKLKKSKLIPPSMTYIMGLVVAFFKKFGTHMKLTFDDGEVIDSELTLTAIGNGKFCGGGFKALPFATLEDGIFDICIIKKVSRATFLSLVSSYKAGTYPDNPKAGKHITYKRASHLKMEFDEPIPICIDGEIYGAKTVDLSIVKNGFNFVVPKGCELLYKTESEEKKEETVEV